MGWDAQTELSKHGSQTDAAKGFGGKYGVQKEKQDTVCVCVYACMFMYYNTHIHIQSAVGWEYQSELSKHESQTDAAKGFGGRYGVQQDRQDEVSIHIHKYESVCVPSFSDSYSFT